MYISQLLLKFNGLVRLVSGHSVVESIKALSIVCRDTLEFIYADMQVVIILRVLITYFLAACLSGTSLYGIFDRYHKCS